MPGLVASLRQPDPTVGLALLGAGLGLYLVLANVASLIVNVAPGEQTEVICLFDLSRPTTQGAVTRGVRSLHVFAGD